MSPTVTDWRWKIRDAAERIRTAYSHIGRSSGAPLLAIVYPPGQDLAFRREWEAQTTGFEVRTVDALEVVGGETAGIGLDNIVETLSNPMPGADPEDELGRLWTDVVADRIRIEAARSPSSAAPIVVVVFNLAALFPASGPRAVMQAVWDSAGAPMRTVVVFPIPGTLLQPRHYSFLDRTNEFMYRGDIF